MNGETMEQISDRLRAEREALEEAARVVVYPAPEHSSRDPWPADFVAPRPAVSLRLLAESHGFTVTMTYARGHRPHGTTGQPTALRHSVAVRMFHAETRRAAVAVSTSPVTGGSWEWDTVLLWGADHPLFPHASITDAKDWIKARGMVDARWFSSIRRRIREKDVKAKAARPVGSGRKRGPMS